LLLLVVLLVVRRRVSGHPVPLLILVLVFIAVDTLLLLVICGRIVAAGLGRVPGAVAVVLIVCWVPLALVLVVGVVAIRWSSGRWSWWTWWPPVALIRGFHVSRRALIVVVGLRIPVAAFVALCEFVHGVNASTGHHGSLD